MPSPSQSSRRILLAADRLARLDRLREQLEPAGFLTEQAGDWSSLAQHLKDSPADAILGDFDELSEAATFCTRVRTAGIGLPLLFLLPTDKCPDRDSLRMLGAQGCLPRSTENDRLHQELAALCSIRLPESEPPPLVLRTGLFNPPDPARPAPVSLATGRPPTPEAPLAPSGETPRPAATVAPGSMPARPPVTEDSKQPDTQVVFPTFSPLDGCAPLPDQQPPGALAPFAAGVAHGFSECLTAIVGYANLLLEAPNLPLLPRRDAEGILRAANQGTQLTRRLLAIGRNQVLRPSAVELNATILSLERAIRDLAGPGLAVKLELGRALPRALVDPSALRQAILDLAAFACGGQNPAGSLTLSSSHAPDGASAPRGVCLTLARTGLLLDEAALQRLFVPFGRGDRAGALDGLALASAEGTIAQSGGSLLARQMPPGGLQLVLNLPAAPAMESQPEALQTEAHEPAPAATGTILLADDEELLRGVAVRILEEAGYRVLVARNGLEALELAHLHTGQVDLLLTDVVMPKMGGFELATRLRTRHPQLKILFMSGFSEGGLFPAQGERSGLMFLQKPFSPALLLSRIRSMMVERAPSNVAPAWRRDCPA